MNTATFIRRCEAFTGDARLYRVAPPMAYEGAEELVTTTEYVVVSAAIAMFSGAETYIFPADADGEILSWGEMDGSFRGSLDHETALSRRGPE